MKINELKSTLMSNKSRKRVGRGSGSGLGKTSGRGVKGQKSRSGVSIKGFEGGQMPIHRRLPKRGFNNIFRKEYIPINLGSIQKLLDEKKLPLNKILNTEIFIKAGLIKKSHSLIKILGTGTLKNKVEIVASSFSKNAKSKIEKVGGKITAKKLVNIKNDKKNTNEKTLNGE